MASLRSKIFGEVTLDALLCNQDALRAIPELSEVVNSFLEGNYKTILQNHISQTLFQKLEASFDLTRSEQVAALRYSPFEGDVGLVSVAITGLAAFNAFLQANVTGPPLDLKDIFEVEGGRAGEFKARCFSSLEIDGASVYQFIPHIELFCLARLIFTIYFPRIENDAFRDCKWLRVRVNAYHQRLLAGVSMGRLIDSRLLENAIEEDLAELEDEIVVPESKYSTEAKVQFLLEKAQIYITEGLDLKAMEEVKTATSVSAFSYALSGALGKRTKFQQDDLSQLVVFARSNASSDSAEDIQMVLDKHYASNNKGPRALQLDDDTLLESIKFTKSPSDVVVNSSLPKQLADLQPDEQPQLNPLDQIILLTEATLKDNLSPLDKLNSEEILPYAVRVLSDKPSNWQIYTQALLVRTRIEAHRSRTMERSVLQLQVIVDQIIADTQEAKSAPSTGVPEITVTQFLPRAKADESAPVQERLKYIFQLNTPTRWEIETELAFAWSNAGSFVSALEIFKRLRLWPEVALCYHSVHQEEKARQIVRRQLYQSLNGAEIDEYDVDAAEVAVEKWEGEIRSPPPPHAPRLWCILGDLDQDPSCWERAWEVSKNRYARAQRTLGEYYSRQGDLGRARDAYMKATIVNRQNNETWSRLGDIDLASGNWDGAVVAFQQSIMIDDTDAKTYSNLGSALLSQHAEMIKMQKAAAKDITMVDEDGNEEDIDISHAQANQPSPKDILRQALLAFKRGAALAHDNWKIWDNVITIAGRMSPPSFTDLLMGMRAVIQIRNQAVGEYAVDADVLRAVILEVTSRERPENTNPAENEGPIYTPPRGSLARATIELFSNEIEPLITKRAELWALLEKLSLYRRDYVNALASAEKASRISSAGEEWLQDVDGWRSVVAATDNLVSAYENYGPQEKEDGSEVEKGWRMKARSAIRVVMGKARDSWEGTEEWELLESRLEDLKA